MFPYYAAASRFIAASGYDTNAQAYIAAVETADGAALETAVRDAINAFVVGCKDDGIWSAIKASCIMAGARTLAGCLVPLVGPAPTNTGFVSGDYNRKTGLLGSGTKRLDSNRNSNADPQNSYHNFLNVTQHATGTAVYMGCGPGTNENGATNFGRSGTLLFSRNRSAANGGATSSSALGLFGTTRQTSASFTAYTPTSATLAISSQAPFAGNIFVFSSSSGAFPAAIRANYYSIGEYVDGTLMSSRVATLMSALAAAIA